MLLQNGDLIQSSTKPRLIHIVLLTGIVLGATLLRAHALGKTSYWYDEICSVLYAHGQTRAIFDPPLGYFDHAPALASRAGMRGWKDVWLGFDTTPPMYPILLRLWSDLFGESDIAGRSLSVALSALTVAVLFDVGRMVITPSAALWACALCAASPPMVRYAQEARAYALLCLLGVLICDVTLRIARSPRRGWRYLLLGFLCAAAFLTHNFIAGGIAAVGLFAVLKLRGRARIALLCAIAAALFVEMWELPILLNHSQNVAQGIDWTAEPRQGLLLHTIYRIAWLPLTFLILPPGDPGPAMLPMLVIFILPLIFQQRRPGMLLVGLWPLGIIGLVAASDLWLAHGALLYTRYTLAAAPMIFISFAAIAELGGPWIKHLMPMLTVLGALQAVPEGSYLAETSIKPESRQLALDVGQNVKPGDVLVVASGPKMGLISASNQYLEIDFYAGPLPCAAAILEGPVDRQTRQKIWAHQRVWVVRCFGDFRGGRKIDPGAYLGPCKLIPAGDVHLFAGRLFRAERTNSD